MSSDNRIGIAREYLADYEAAIDDLNGPVAWYYHAGRLSGAVKILLDLIEESQAAVDALEQVHQDELAAACVTAYDSGYLDAREELL